MTNMVRAARGGMGRGMAKHVLAAGVAAAAFHAAAQTSNQVHHVTLPQIKAIEAAKSARTPAQQKVSSQLLDALAESQTGMVNSHAASLKADKLPQTPSGVLVDIKAKVTPQLLDEVTKKGGVVVNQHPRFDALRASVPLGSVEAIAALPEVKSISPAVKATPNAALVATEGAIAHTAILARQDFGVSGKGVTVCVLSDSIDDANNAKQSAFATGALLKAQVHVLPGEDGAGDGEGLAMLEIIHAIAPDAELWFATADGGPAHMADNILGLRDVGCNVIVDDITYYNESPFQDDAISIAVNEVSNSGVLYFSSARNSGNKKHGTSGTWEGDFTDGGLAGPKFSAAGPKGRVHIFENGITLDTADHAGIKDRVDLFWSDPLGASTNGYDLFVVNSQGQVVHASTTSHTGTQDPYQFVEHLHQGESIVIVKEDGAAPRFLHLDTGRAVLRHSTTGSVRGHNASGAANAFSVAAKKVPTPAAPFVGGQQEAVETFSSDGPRRVFFDPDGAPYTPGNFGSTGGKLVQKPDLTAADGVTTTLPPGGLNPFFGTSAAAPHAAAIAALMLSCTPHPTPQAVRQALKGSALAIEGDPSNINAGYGIIMAHAAVQGLCQAQAHPTVAAAGR